MSAALLPGPYRLTFRDWLTFPDDGRLYELLDGELHATPPPDIEHQRLSRDLQHALLVFLRGAVAGEVLAAPVAVKLTDETVVERARGFVWPGRSTCVTRADWV